MYVKWYQIMHQKETHVLRNTIRILPILLVLLFGFTSLAHAQGGSLYFGAGTATDSSTGTVDPFDIGGGTAPVLNGVFGIFGGDAMFKPNLGVGVAVSTRFKQAPYSGLNYRTTFYDFNAVWQPLPPTKRIAAEFQGGVGGAKVSFYEGANQLIGPSSYLVGSSNHFNIHASAGIRFYVTEHVYVRPQVDLYYVPNYIQFGRDAVPEVTVSIGYAFAR
jgi:hypothetical protein